VHPLAICGFANAKALSKVENPKLASLPFDSRRQGFVLSEGAGILILEEMEHALARNAQIHAEIVGYGNTCDAYHLTAPQPDAKCAANAIKLAAAEARLTPDDLIHVNAHGTGTPLNDKTETNAIKIALGQEAAYKALITSTKSMTGHALGAAGGFEAIAAVLALKNGMVPPTIGLEFSDPECDLDYVPHTARKANITIAFSNSFGFGGHNGSIALRQLTIDN
jgi:3-oxoacyl-[acyl-carrier-protein] synthase II